MESREATELEKFLIEEFAKIWRVLKLADTELEAYKQAVTALEIAYPGVTESLNAYVATARQSPVLHEKIVEKYSLILKTSLQRFRGKLPARIRERFDALY